MGGIQLETRKKCESVPLDLKRQTKVRSTITTQHIAQETNSFHSKGVLTVLVLRP